MEVAILELLDVGRRWLRVRFIQLVGLVFAGVMGMLAAEAAFHMTAEAGGPLLPLWERLSIAALSLAGGIAVLLAAMIFGTRYVTRLERHGDHLDITTLGWLRARRFRVATAGAVVSGRHEGRAHGRQSVHAPWRTLRLPGYRFPFILDLQAPILDEPALTRIGRPAKPPKRRRGAASKPRRAD